MDKYEYKISAEEIKDLIAQGEYGQAAEIADTIDWRRVKSVMMLCTISDLYKINRRYEDAKNMLLLAYERRPGGRTICYSLCELCIKTEEYVQALNYYKEFVQVAPKDPGRYVLQYKLYEAQDVSLEERIGVLEELKKRDYREKWAYELAYLYHRVGLETRCVEECDEMILWFGEGRYVTKAMELKMLHQPLTPDQQEKYDGRFGGQEMYQDYGTSQETENAYGEAAEYRAYEQADAAGGQDGTAEYEDHGGYQEAGAYGAGAYDPEGYMGENAMYQDGAAEYGPAGYVEETMYQNDAAGYGTAGYVEEETTYQDNAAAYGAEGYVEETMYQGDAAGYDAEGYDAEEVMYQEAAGNYETGSYGTDRHGTEETAVYQGDGIVYETDGEDLKQQEALLDPRTDTRQPDEIEIQVKTMDVGQYNTINLQAELAAGLREVLKDEQSGQEESGRAGAVPAIEREADLKEKPGEKEETQKAGEKEAERNVSHEEGVQEEESGKGESEEENLSGEGQENHISYQGAEVVESSEVFFGETEEIGKLPSEILPEETVSDEAGKTAMEQLRTEHVRREEEVLTAQPPRELAGVLSQESDGQISLVMPEGEMIEKQITGQMNIEDVLAEWEQMKKENAQKQKEEVRRRVLQQTGDMFTEFEAAVRDGVLERLESGLPVDLEAIPKSAGGAFPEETGAEEEDGSVETAGFAGEEEPVEPGEDGFAESGEFEEEESGESGEYAKEEEFGEYGEFLAEEESEEQTAGEEEFSDEENEPAESEEIFGEEEESAGSEEFSDDEEEPAESEEPSGEEEEFTGPEEFSDDEEGPAESEELSGEEKESTEAQKAAAEKEKTSARMGRSTRQAGLKQAIKAPRAQALRRPEGTFRAGNRGTGRPPVERDKAKLRSLTREEKELFGPFIQSRAAREQLIKALDSISMAAFTGNIIITGEEGMDTLTLAKNMIREVQVTDSNFSGKVAKISGKALNNKDVAATLKRLKNGALIIENAPGMDGGTMTALHKALQQESLGIIIVLEGTKKAINKLLEADKELASCFTARMDVEALSNDMLVAFGKQYAREQEYAIDELGVLALHTRVDEMQTSDHVVTVMEVKEIVDEAIRHANRKTLGHFFDILLAKRYDEEDMIVLSEKDFV